MKKKTTKKATNSLRVPAEDFVRSYMKHKANISLVANELGLNANSVQHRARALRKKGVRLPNTNRRPKSRIDVVGLNSLVASLR